MDDLRANNFPRRNSLLSSVAQQHWERASSLLPLDVGWAEGHGFWWILAKGLLRQGCCNYTEHNRPRRWQNLAFKALAKELFFWSLLCHTGFETSSLNIPNGLASSAVLCLQLDTKGPGFMVFREVRLGKTWFAGQGFTFLCKPTSSVPWKQGPVLVFDAQGFGSPKPSWG